MRLTPAGEVLRKRADELIRQISLIPEELSADTHQPAGLVALALPPSMISVLSAPLIKQISSRFPQIRLTLREMTLASLRQALASNEVSLGIGSIPFTDPDFDVQPILQEPMYLVGTRSWRPRRSYVTWREIADLPLILPPRPNSIRIIVENMLERSGRSPNVVLETDFGPAFECVASAIGYCVIPGCALLDPALGSRVHSARIRESSIGWALIQLKSRAPTPATLAIRSTALEVIKNTARRGRWQPRIMFD
jgi:LysR family nitrogen assimilation transcriptional regulator